MSITLFVSEEYMKNNLPISRNLDNKDIQPNIQMSQELYTQDILGTNFYEYLMDVYSGGTLNANETILVRDYIKPQVAYRALSLALPFLQYSIKNKGSQTQFEDFSNTTDFTSFKFLLSKVDDRSEFYEKRMVKYLCENGNLFPEYQTDNSDIFPPNNSNGFSSGLLFY